MQDLGEGKTGLCKIALPDAWQLLCLAFGVCGALKHLLNLSFFECISLELSIILGLAYLNKCV